jgi:hypothetical protein
MDQAIQSIYKEKNTWIVVSKLGYKYLLDDVDEDGMIYTPYINKWFKIFFSTIDLLMIKEYKLRQELDEIEEYYKRLLKSKRVSFNDSEYVKLVEYYDHSSDE